MHLFSVMCSITAIAAGSNFSMALTVGGSILAFGANTHGQLGTGDQVSHALRRCLWAIHQ